MKRLHGICHARSATKHRRKGHAVNFAAFDKHGHRIYFWCLPEYSKPEYIKHPRVAQGPRKGLSGRMMD